MERLPGGSDPTNGTDALGFDGQGDDSYQRPAAEILASLLEKGVLDVDKVTARRAGSAGEDSFLDSKSRTGSKAQKPAGSPGVVSPSQAPTGQANGLASTEGAAKYGSPRISADNKSSDCVGCHDDVYANRKSPSRSLLSERSDGKEEPVTSFVWPVGQGTVDLEFRKSFAKGDRPSVAESQEDSGSGDPHVKMPPSQVTHASASETEWNLRDFMDVATLSPSQTSTAWSNAMLSPSTEKAISPDSAEIDHLLQVPGETSVQSPPPSGTEPGRDGLHESQKGVGYEAGNSQGPFTAPEKDSRQTAEQGAQGSTDVTVVTEKAQVDISSTGVPPKPSEPPSDLTDIDYRDPSDLDDHLGYPPGGDSTKGFHDKLGPWHKHLHYDDFSPFDYLYPTPPFYADGYEEGGIEDDDDDEDDLEDDDDGVTAKDVRNFPKGATLKVHTPTLDEKPTGRQDFPFRGETYPRPHPEVIKDQTQTMSGTGENGTECRSGYVRRNSSCKSLCEVYPTYCYNGGQCYIVENIGAYCRCNTQDYIWHKGLRCESIITDFQVMCVAVGTAALVVLLLFMMTVFFAKKLYLLKTENYKLRKRKYRTPSELHNDNFSLSTIAEGSHPNVRKLCDTPCHLSPHARALAYYDNVICQEDPNAPQKVQDLPKVCLKDEEPFNIQNSLSPKHECSKGDPDIVDVNCVLNNLT
ncbi:PREDICTED: chondroitin sulfate proteoglycan 5 [Nanorana parkeri]|uniref:chondroitin sulfate proteoglycan 5 n=1 Tax=Nanorana parkeri TaxID=125878 RepID=UPI00085436EC|nr:PREDICTED: chondroitin sulfate proteoglycan 5 [Nanorana parkeri]